MCEASSDRGLAGKNLSNRRWIIFCTVINSAALLGLVVSDKLFTNILFLLSGLLSVRVLIGFALSPEVD